MNKTALIIALMMTAGQIAAVGEIATQKAEYYGYCNVEGCTAGAIHAHEGRVCLPCYDHYNSYHYNNDGNPENYEGYDRYYNSGNYHHSQHRGGHHR